VPLVYIVSINILEMTMVFHKVV